MIYDDEGYVLWSLHDVAAGHALYTEVYSQYGPFPYLIYRLLGWLGYPFTSDAARVVAGLCWLGTAALTGSMVSRLTRSTLYGLAGMLLTWTALTDMRSEPGHPGGLLALLTALAAWYGIRQIAGQRWQALAGTQAGFGTVMLLSKINVGVFHLLGSLLWWAVGSARFLSDPLRRVMLAGATVALAGVLMRGLIQEPAVQAQFAIFACMMVPLALSHPASSYQLKIRRPCFAAGAVFLVVMAVTAGATLASGTSVDDLLRHVVLAPLRQPSVYHHFVRWQPLVWLPAMLSLGGAVAWLLANPENRRRILFALKWAALLGLGWGVWHAALGGVENALYQWVAPLGWALALPLQANVTANDICARRWLAALLGWHWLQAYPVAGTQVAWGSFLAAALAIVALHDLLPTGRGRFFGPVVAGLLALVATGDIGRYAWQFWRNGQPLDLPGARTLRLESRLVSTLRTVTANVRANAGMLFTYPGMLSLNQWTGVPPPTHANTTHWFSLLNPTQQEAIRVRLEATPDALVVVQREHVQYLINAGLGPSGPLKDYLQARYQPVLRIDGYDIWSRHPGRFVPQSVARALEVGNRLTVVLWTQARLANVKSIAVIDPANGMLLSREILSPETWQPAPWPAQPKMTPGNQLRYSWLPSSSAGWVRRPAVELHLIDPAGVVLDRLRLDHSPLIAPAFTDALPPPTD